MQLDVSRYSCDQWEELKRLVEKLISQGILGYALISEVHSGNRPDTSAGRVDVPDKDSDNPDDEVMWALMDEAESSGADISAIFLSRLQVALTEHMTGARRTRFRLKLMSWKGVKHLKSKTCLLYTSDAADE